MGPGGPISRGACNENFGTGPKMERVPCKIWHGQENNGMTIKMSNCGIAASSQDIRTMIEAVHVLDRQAGGIQMGVVRQENGRTQSSMSDMKFVKKRTIEWVS